MRWSLLLILVAACNESELPEPECRTAVGLVPCSPPEPERPITVTWAFYPMVGGPELVGRCRDGVANVELHTSANTMKSIPCGAERSGEIQVPFGDRLLVRLVDAAGATVAETPPEDPQGRIQIRAPFYEDGGYARVVWRVHAGGINSPPPSRCFDNMPLRVTATDPQGVQVLSRTYACPQNGTFQLLSDPLVENTYTLTFVGLGGSQSHTVPIGRNNAVTDLDVVTP